MDALTRCLRGLAVQEGAPEFETIVSFDGEAQADAAGVAVLGRELGLRLTVIEGALKGVGAAKNRALDVATGELLVFLNDDVVPEKGLLAAHASMHEGADAPPVMAVGRSPIEKPRDATRFDALMSDTSAVFFYDRMEGVAADHDFGFRHAWGLNLSVESARVRGVGRFVELDHPYGYEDIELAFRIVERWGARVVYARGAVAAHEHRMTPDGYLTRELGLGYCAPSLALRSGKCAQAIFGRDILDEGEIEADRAALRRDRASAMELTAWFRSLARERSVSSTQTALDYERHLTLKRYCWRAGRLAQASGCEGPPSLRSLGLMQPETSAG